MHNFGCKYFLSHIVVRVLECRKELMDSFGNVAKTVSACHLIDSIYWAMKIVLGRI